MPGHLFSSVASLRYNHDMADDMPPVAQQASTAHIVRRQLTLDTLRAAEKLQGATIALRLLFGLILSLIVPLIATKLVELLGFVWGFEDALPATLWLLVICAVVLIPVMMLLVGRAEPTPTDEPGAVVSQVFTAGPRMLWSGMDALAGRRVAHTADDFLAAEIVEELFNRGKGTDIADLLVEPRTQEKVDAAILRLRQLDLADRSTSGQRVWLSSEFRVKLVAAAGEPSSPPPPPRHFDSMGKAR